MPMRAGFTSGRAARYARAASASSTSGANGLLTDSAASGSTTGLCRKSIASTAMSASTNLAAAQSQSRCVRPSMLSSTTAGAGVLAGTYSTPDTWTPSRAVKVTVCGSAAPAGVHSVLNARARIAARVRAEPAPSAKSPAPGPSPSP